MIRRILVVSFCLLMAIAAFSADKKSAGSVPDKALMQTIWSGWATLNPANVSQYYAGGPHTFFDIAPLKYASWDEYQKGVTGVLAGYQSATCTVNDDAEIHNAGSVVWGTATVKYDMVQKTGKHDMGNFRWTVVWQKEDGKWLIVHEHVSEPIQ